jgi:acyl-CoA synthetase (NDP forming)
VDIRSILEKAAARPNRALNEHESKQMLGACGVPVVKEQVVQNPAQAVAAAEQIGYPVVLKGLGANLLHKTERGLVHLNVSDALSVRLAAEKILAEAGPEIEGLLVSPQLTGRREFVAGLFRDPLFGPVVMFGVGGIFTEALSDVSFRLAPLREGDAAEMIQEIRSAKLLDALRGEAPVDRQTLMSTLMALSAIGVQYPQVAEIDINPLLVTPAGSPMAVDALVVTGAGTERQTMTPAVSTQALGRFFHPRSIAFVGVSAQFGKWGHMLFSITAASGYGGPIFLVNPKGGTLAGKTVYQTVTQIPDPVDLAVVTVPAARVMDLIPEFQTKGIHNMLLVTSGFGEIGLAGKDLEHRLVAEAGKAGILIVGPNTMGICNPHIGLYCTGSHVRPLPGTTAVVAQSGNMGTQLLAFAEKQGIGIRAFAGSGNEAMITIEDYMEGFEVDDKTQTVMLYVESVKNGRRFFESARRVGRKKPIVLLKGGQSQVGNRAAASHTGAMSSDARVFDAMCRQAGIVKVEHPTDLLDLSAAFSSLPLPKGNRAAIMTLGGGWGVVTADLCARYGLEVPALAQPIIERIDTILPPYWSRANPVDIVGENDPSIPLTVIEELLAWDGCDAVINLGILGRRILLFRLADSVGKADCSYSQQALEAIKKAILDFETTYIETIVALMEKYGKPVLGVSLLTDEKDLTVYPVAGSRYKGVFYETPERAVKSFAKMVQYHRFLTRR